MKLIRVAQNCRDCTCVFLKIVFVLDLKHVEFDYYVLKLTITISQIRRHVVARDRNFSQKGFPPFTVNCNILAEFRQYILGIIFFPSTLSAFLPRDAMQARSMLSCSVRPSVTFVDHVKTNKHIFEIFSQSGSDTILVFSVPKEVPILRRKLP